MDYTKVPGSATAYRRQKQIEECLYHNLLQRPYSSVSISDLCHQLGISRKSFYNYFPDKDSCFRSIVSRLLRQCSLCVTSVSKEAPQEAVVTAFLNFWKENRSLMDILTRNNLMYLVMDQCVVFLRDEDKAILEFLNTPQVKNDAYVLSVFVSTHITLLLQWYHKGFETPVPEMVLKYQRLVYEPLISLESVAGKEEPMETDSASC